MLGRSEKDFITVKDVPANSFILAYADHLKKTQKIQVVPNAHFIKTSHASQRNPYNEDWFYVRAAAIARKVYLKPEVGVGNLKQLFGRTKNNGNAPYSHASASGSLIRFALHQLEKANVLMRLNDKRNKSSNNLPDIEPKKLPRVISPEGHKELNEIAKQVYNKLNATN